MKELINKIKTLKLGSSYNDLEKIENLIEENIKKEPNNIELWLRLAILELIPPLYDIVKSMHCLNEIIKQDPNNIEAILLLVYIQDALWEGIEDSLFEKLCILETDDNEFKALIEMAKAKYFKQNNNDEMYESSLIDSIKLYKDFVWNYHDLGVFYLRKGKEFKAKQFLSVALKNVKLVYNSKNTIEDLTDIKEFFNEYLKGIHLSESNYKSILDLFEKGIHSSQLRELGS